MSKRQHELPPAGLTREDVDRLVSEEEAKIKALVERMSQPAEQRQFARDHLMAVNHRDGASRDVDQLLKRVDLQDKAIVSLARLAREGFSQGWDGLDAQERLGKIDALLVMVDLVEAASK